MHSRLACDDRDIVFVWFPGHVGTWGNSNVDLAAEHVLEKPVNKRLAVPYSEYFKV